MTSLVRTSAARPIAQTLVLLQNWVDYVPPKQRRLGKFIGVAAAVHVIAFLFIRIDATRPRLERHLRTQVTLESSALGVAQPPSDALWDRLTDPRLYVLPSPARVAQPDLGALAREQEADLHPVPLPTPAEIGSYPFFNQPTPPLSARVAESLHPPRLPFAYVEHSPAMAKATTWQWSEVLQERSPAGTPSLPSPVSDTDISPTRLRVAVKPDGTVSDAILDQSSRRPELDQQAILAAQKVRFQPSTSSGLAWGFVTVSWYYTPTPREAAPPTPPLAQ